jgi:hypothetical protein
MKHCIDCKHYEEADSFRWWDLFTILDPYDRLRFQDKCNNVSLDMVTGEPRQASAQHMRSFGGCGSGAALFEPKS